MKYHKKFQVRDDPRKLYRRIQIIKEFLKGKTMASIAQEQNCTIKTVENGLIISKILFIQKKGNK